MQSRNQSTSTDQAMDTEAQFNGQNATENLIKEGFFKQKSEELFHQEPVNDTPFQIIMQWDKDENGPYQKWFITWNKYRLSADLSTKEECEDLIRQRNWHLIGIYIGAIIEEYKEFLKQQVEKKGL
jgi:hypothetical protein